MIEIMMMTIIMIEIMMMTIIIMMSLNVYVFTYSSYQCSMCRPTLLYNRARIKVKNLILIKASINICAIESTKISLCT